VDFLFAAGSAGVPVADLDAAELDREFSNRTTGQIRLVLLLGSSALPGVVRSK
jgi:hypothetical protein